MFRPRYMSLTARLLALLVAVIGCSESFCGAVIDMLSREELDGGSRKLEAYLRV